MKPGKDPFSDMAHFVQTDRPVIFDVGANVGQTISRIRSWFPTCVIHSFEPGPATFRSLSQNASDLKDVSLWNCALGSTTGQATFLENSFSEMSSFLPLGNDGWGEVTKETSVDVNTVDQFCSDQGIEQIDVLKCDTQGFELEVFKGAKSTISANRIGLIYFEVTFSDIYENLPTFAEIYEFLANNDFRLVSLYDFHFENRLASWSDALFVHKSYLQPGT